MIRFPLSFFEGVGVGLGCGNVIENNKWSTLSFVFLGYYCRCLFFFGRVCVQCNQSLHNVASLSWECSTWECSTQWTWSNTSTFMVVGSGDKGRQAKTRQIRYIYIFVNILKSFERRNVSKDTQKCDTCIKVKNVHSEKIERTKNVLHVCMSYLSFLLFLFWLCEWCSNVTVWSLVVVAINGIGTETSRFCW